MIQPQDKWSGTLWSAEDKLLDEEFADVIPIIRSRSETSIPPPTVPSSIDSKVKKMAESRVVDSITDNWLLGQGPRVILVTCILFSIAMLVLLTV